MRNFDSSVNSSDLINGFYLRAESSMNTEDLSINDSSDRQVVKDLSTIFPRIGISILSIDLIVKSINCCDLSN